MPGWTNITRDLNPRARSRHNTNPSPIYIPLITAGVGTIQSRERAHEAAGSTERRKKSRNLLRLEF